MSEIKDMEQAKNVFETLCSAFDNRNWHYKKDEEQLAIECKPHSEDLPIELTMKVDAERMLVSSFSHLPFEVKEDKRLDVAIAISAINYMLVDGSFDFDIKSGHIFYRMTNSYRESIIGEEVFTYLLQCSGAMIDEYNDKLLMLGKGMITIEQFLTSIQN